MAVDELKIITTDEAREIAEKICRDAFASIPHIVFCTDRGNHGTLLGGYCHKSNAGPLILLSPDPNASTLVHEPAHHLRWGKMETWFPVGRKKKMGQHHHDRALFRFLRFGTNVSGIGETYDWGTEYPAVRKMARKEGLHGSRGDGRTGKGGEGNMSTAYRNSSGVIYANERLFAVVVPTEDGKSTEELSLLHEPKSTAIQVDPEGEDKGFLLEEHNAMLEALRHDRRWDNVSEQASQDDEARQKAFSAAKPVLWDEARRRMRLHVQYTPAPLAASGTWNVVPNFDEYKRWFRTFKSEAVGEGFSPSDAAGYAEVMASRWVWGHTEYDV